MSLGLSNHVIEGCVGDGILPVAIFKYVNEPDPTMGANFSKRHCAGLKKFDDERAAHIQQVCCFGSGDFSSKSSDTHAVSGL